MVVPRGLSQFNGPFSERGLLLMAKNIIIFSLSGFFALCDLFWCFTIIGF